MNFPICGKQLEEGYLSSKSPVFWSTHVSGLSFPSQKGDIMLGKAFGLLRPKAFLCRDCHKVIVDY